MEQTVKELKKQMRALMKAKRAEASLSPQADCAATVLALPQWQSARTVLLYCSIPGEVPTESLIEAAVKMGKRVVLPLVKGDDLLLKEYLPGALVEGYKGIMEPSAEAKDVAPEEIDLALIPGVAFDRKCRRLGRGRGYYDRTLPALACPKIGLAFAWQIVDEVPCDPWDMSLDLVVTPDTVIG